MSGGEPDGLRLPAVQAVEQHNSSVVVRLAGELDLYNSGDVAAALAEAAAGEPERVVVDLSAVMFVDSTALGTLVETRKRMKGALLLAAPGVEVRRALEVSGLAQHFGVHDSVDDALAATA